MGCTSSISQVRHDLNSWSGSSVEDRALSVDLLDCNVAQNTNVVLLPSFFSEEDIEFVRKISADFHALVGESDASGWSTRYLNAGGFFHDRAPHLLSKLKAAAFEVDATTEGWGVLSKLHCPSRLQPRVIEHHLVTPGGALADPSHYDEGSIITADVMLSDPQKDFRGGKFQTREGSFEFKSYDFRKGDLMLFISHKYHCVQRVLWGKREVLVTELWEGRPCKCRHRCYSRWDPCSQEALALVRDDDDDD
eukprot:TRINITY_DN42137_c0_g1_i1.p1 TRINITY_DN42137_c0_g1~~TRINITY_DN42137_c0_g1_i1.p1  ORF type:complete len:250 (-),score=22.94 TRINITY_DN42137_c0_g1_i1:203-952(-)